MTEQTAPATFAEAIAYLASFTDYEQKEAEKLSREALDLDRMEGWVERLGRPHEAVPVVHVAGTKGKGSVTWMLDALLRAHGLRTGRFLSPHVEHVTERIAIDGKQVTEERFAQLVAKIHEPVEDRRTEAPGDLPSFFESITLMAFMEFAERRVDAAVIEVGLGGRLDATNVVTPEVGVITSIDLEHTRVLGDTREAIAAEKAGIIKPSMDVVCGVPKESPEGEVIATIAEARGANVLWLTDAELFIDTDGSGTRLELELAERTLRDVPVGPLGHHQATNAALALLALDLLERKNLVEIDDDAVRDALGRLSIPARLEMLQPSQMTKTSVDVPVLLDCAHTPGSMTGLAAATRRVFEGKKTTLLLGMLRDKRIDECLSAVGGAFDNVLIVAPNSPRALDVTELAEAVRRVLDVEPVILDDLAAMPEAVTATGAEALVVAGSIYLAGSVRTAFGITG